jgi:LysR family transcriptional regulator for metE and metH
MRKASALQAVEIRHLRLIAAIAEHGSITAAGRVLNLTQSALSHQLRELESRLRSPMFMRTARRMVLTPAGEQLTHIARSVLSQIDSFERQVLDGSFSTTRGSVRIATECYTAYHWLPAVLRDFRVRWPNVDLDVRAEHTASPIPALRDGALDLALVYSRVADKRVRVEPLFDDELVIVTAPDHRFAGSTYVSVEALAKEHLFVYTQRDGNSTVSRDILEPAGVEPARITRIQLTEAIIELVAAGLGVAVLAKWAVLPAVRSGAVQTARIGKKGFTRTWFTAVRKKDVTPPWQFDLMALLRRHLSAGPTVRTAQQLRVS